VSDTQPTLEDRVQTLERQVDLLRRAIALLVVSTGPTVQWLEDSWDPSAKPTPRRKRL
jgi:hypothetical protein